jgi:hypothetical protein
MQRIRRWGARLMDAVVRYLLCHTIPQDEPRERARIEAEQREYYWLLERLHQEQQTRQQYDVWGQRGRPDA